MICNRCSTQFIKDLLRSLTMIFILASIASASGDVPQESDFTGTWTGVITSAGNPDNQVDLTVTAAEESPYTISYSFHYGPPKSCKLNAVKTSMKSNVISLVFDDASGGFCDKLWHKNMSLELLDKKRIIARLQQPEIEVILTKKE